MNIFLSFSLFTSFFFWHFNLTADSQVTLIVSPKVITINGKMAKIYTISQPDGSFVLAIKKEQILTFF